MIRTRPYELVMELTYPGALSGSELKALWEFWSGP